MTAFDTLAAQDSLEVAFRDGGAQLVLPGEDHGALTNRGEESRLRRHVADIPRWVRRAESFLVDQAMVPLVCSAAVAVEDDATVQPWDLPAPYGFVQVGGRATTLYINAERVSAEAFNGFLWVTFGGQVLVHRLEQDEQDPAVWRLLDVLSVRFGDALPAPSRPHDLAFQTRMVTPGGTLDAEHRQVGFKVGPETRDLYEEATTRVSDPTVRWLVACWRLMRQTIAVVDVERPPGSRVGVKNRPERQVSVIRLRHKGLPGAGDGPGVNWSHRWVVRGHWRQQPVKDEEGNWTTRPVFIHPYIKGPEEAPLLVRRHVNHLVR